MLILADDVDPCVDDMVRRLVDHDTEVHRVNTAWFPTQLGLAAELCGGAWVGELRTPSRTVELERVTAVWWRSPAAFTFPAEWNSVERQHAHHEARFGLGGVLASLPAQWVNHPSRIAEAAYKPTQLVTAAQVGMSVPDTVITNDAATVLRFVECADDGEIVSKMLGAPAIEEEGRRKVAFTRRVPVTGLDLAGLQWTVHQFQRWVPKAHDARVVVVGERHWAVAIHSDSAAGHLDFRRDYDSLRYELVDMPVDVATKVDEFVLRLGLAYAALDFVVDEHGRWWFLECNPAGQYGWLEGHTGAPITDALAMLLAGRTAS